VTSREQVAIRLQKSLESVRDVLVKYDGESGERLAKATGVADESVPSLKHTDLVTAYLAESVASLAKIVDEQLRPRKRGRPPKRKAA
jgi:hypothetical protein